MTYSKWFFLCFISFSVSGFIGNSENNKSNLDYTINWEGEFSKPQKQKVETWLEEVSKAVYTTLGRYPFQVKYNIYMKESFSEPVPWANTIRHDEQGVNFHIDPSFSLNAFQMDWTAAHEISHLSIPFVGRENMWFSEGYASYLQWQILRMQGLYSSEEIEQKYKNKIALVKTAYATDNTFLSQAEQLRRNHNYPALGWCMLFYVSRCRIENQTQHKLTRGNSELPAERPI